MFWLKLLIGYPLIALLLYATSGKTVFSMVVCIVMCVLIKISITILQELTNNH